MGDMKKILLPALSLFLLFLAFPRAVSADRTFIGDGYAITFASGWDTLMSADVLGKTRGLEGLAMLGAEGGTELPDADALASAYADSLGGTLAKGASGTLALGAYQAHWQDFAYDSIPVIRDAITAQVGIPLNPEDGTLRVYHLASDGMVFSIATLAVLPGSPPPYGDIEKAIATLRLGSAAGLARSARYPEPDLAIRGGRLQGSWLAANQVLSVEGYDARGALTGSGRPAAGGDWILPASTGETLLLIRAASGEVLRLRVGP